MSNQEREEQLLYEMMPHVATQLRLSLAGIYVAAARLAPAEERARDTELDKHAAMLLQGYFRLLRLANELDAAPLLASSAPLPTQNTELVEWVNSLVMEAQPLFELQGVKLSVQCALRSHVAAVHRPHLRRALWQLLGNALKYTEAGGTVTVRLHRRGRRCVLEVENPCAGLAPEETGRLFDRFYRGSGAPAGGSGVGLSIVRAAAEAHGGTARTDCPAPGVLRVTVSI